LNSLKRINIIIISYINIREIYNIYSQLPNEKFDKPADYLNFIIYSDSNMKDLIEYIMNVFLENKIINQNPYKII
jgi:hypothetical protein